MSAPDFADVSAENAALRNRCEEMEKQLYRISMGQPRFENVFCSQCGCDFGPGDGGLSHCEDHKTRPVLSLVQAAATFVTDFDALVGESQGVAGLHLNGDIAEWDELLAGGRFDEWLRSLEPLRERVRNYRERLTGGPVS
jgi:hypothetical protein